MNKQPFDVLIIDDDELTAELVERSLRKVDVPCRLVSARDGHDGLCVLRGTTDRQVERPYLILLDLNMPQMNGLEFLEALRADRELRDSLVFVLTSSDAEQDRTRAYQELVAGYMVKSAVGPQFSKLARFLEQFSDTMLLPS